MSYKATNKINFQKSDKEFQSKTKDISTGPSMSDYPDFIQIFIKVTSGLLCTVVNNSYHF